MHPSRILRARKKLILAKSDGIRETRNNFTLPTNSLGCSSRIMPAPTQRKNLLHLIKFRWFSKQEVEVSESTKGDEEKARSKLALNNVNVNEDAYPFKNEDSKETISENNELIFKEIANGDMKVERQLKILEFEVDVLREQFANVPSRLKKKHWIALLETESWFAKKKYLEFLFRNEKAFENRLEKKQSKQFFKRLSWAKQSEDHHIPYGLNSNSMFLRIYKQSLTRLLNHRTMGALLYSNHIVFDCSYGDYMSRLNQKLCAKQLMYAFSENRMHSAPFHLKFCSCNPNETMWQHITSFLNTSIENLPFDTSSQSFLDLYPKEKLVYLTPHCREIMTSVNPDDVYVIGAFVDRGTGKKVSLAKAKNLKLRMAKFPLDEHLDWKRGGKALPLNTVLNILLDMRYYNNWGQAFNNIAHRNVYTNY